MFNQLGKPFFAVVILVVVCLGTFFVVRRANPEFLSVKGIDLSVGWPLDKAPIEKELESLIGKNILAVDTEALGESFISREWVENVRITRSLPRTLKVEINTKQAKAIAYERTGAVFVNSEGETIAPLGSVKGSVPNLPVVRMSALAKGAQTTWNLKDAVPLMAGVSELLAPNYAVSELVLEDYPHFKFYLVAPRVEVIANYNNWKSQLPKLSALIPRFPERDSQTRRINLVFAKKAIVSPPLSN